MANLLSDDDVFGSGSNGLLSDSDVFGGEPEKKQNKGIAGDLATDLKRGVQGLPGVLTGIGDMIVAPVVGDAVVGKGWDLVGKKTGFQPSKWAKDAGEEYSPSRQAENASINKAWEDNSTPFSDAASGDFSGIGGIAKAYVQNPMATAGNVVESIPSMALGGLFGKGLGVASKMSPVVSGAIGEGAVMGGQQMTNLTDSGVDGRTASAASWGTAAGGAFVGGASGRIAKAAGLADIDTALAGGAVRGVSTEAADKTIRGSIKEAAKRVSGGAATEGLLEELPQSVLEQTLSNLAQGKPWSEGVARSAVEGTLAGSLMGGAFNALPGKKEDAQTNPPSADALPEIAGLLPAPTYTGTPGDQLVSADAERQASIDAAESANAKLWEERDAYENLKQDLAKNNVTITTDPAPIQQRIDALMGINENRLTGKARSNYEKALDIAFNEQIGVVVGENSLEVPFTMGDYLKSKVAAADITRDRPKAESANQQAVDRLGQLNSEESQQQPDIPVVGVLSRIANAGIRSGAIRRDQTAPVVPPEIQSNPVSNNLSPTQKIDLSQRTDGQLSYLSNKGRPGLREAAIAEIQRRGQTNAAKAQPLAQEATQANDAQAGIEQAAAQNAEVARSPQAQQGADSPVQQSPTTPSIPPEIVSRVAKRTDKELAFMVKANRDPIVREAVAKEIAIRAADQNKIDAVSQSKPDAAPVKSEQPKPAKGAENGQAETEVLNLPGAVKDAAHVKPNVLREARDRRKAKESLPDNDAGLIEPVPDLSESSRQALYESLKSRMLKGEVTLQYGQRQLAAFDEAVKARDEAMQDTADGNPSEEKPSQPKTDNDPEAKQEQATASTEEKSDSGTVDRSKWSIGKYRHAKDSVVLSITEPDGYKGRLARISEALGARYVGRANGYVTSEKKARKAIDLAGKGWDASSFNGELTEPTDEKSKNSDEAVNATVDAGNDEKSEFVKAPDGSIDFGEITKEMSNAMRRQPGKIRLEKGDDSYGEQHIESRRGNQIRGMGFKSIAAFVSDAVKHIESIWKPSKTSQMVLIQATENGKAVFIELKQSDSGDFYTVNTAFPIGSSYTNNKDKWSLLWSGASVPTVASGANPLAESSPNAGVTTTMTPGQSSNSSVAKSEPESKIEDFGKKLYNIADDNVQLSEESARWSSIVSDFFAGKISKTETPTVLRNTPAVLQALGLPDYEIKISLAHGVEDAMYNHGIKPSQLKAIPNLMTDPQAVFVNKGADVKYSLNVLTGITVNGRQVAIALQPSKHGMAPGKVHFIATITPRENGVFAKMAENGFLVYSGNDIPQDISSGLRKATMKYGQSAIDLKALMASKFDSTARTSKIIYRSDVVNLIESGQAQFSADGDVKISPADKAIYGMATEGRSAADILKFIASASRSPFNRQVAKLLMKTGIAPTITVGDGKGWKFNAGEGNKYAAGYDPKKDMISLFRPAAAERNMLHELIHAATIRALGKRGLASIQMKALYNHVKKSGKINGMYGMSDVDEFIAEAFSNPKFQSMLKQVSAPISGGKPASAWNWFIRIVRGILGLNTGHENALSRALDLGVEVMREDKAIRRAINLPETAGIAERNDYVNRAIEQWAAGELKSGVILDLGKPSVILKRFGVPDLPVTLTQRVLIKAVREKHDVEVADLNDLVVNIQAPIAVFKSKRDGKIVVVTDARHADGNIVVALDLDVTRDSILINDVRSIYPKRDSSVAQWVADGLLLGADKHKGRDWLENSAGSNSQQPQVNAALDKLIIYDGRLIRKAAETAVIRYAEGQKQTDSTNQDIRYNVADDESGATFNDISAIQQDAVNRAIDRAIALEQGKEIQESSRTSALLKLRSLRRKLDAGTINSGAFIFEVNQLHAALEQNAANKKFAPIKPRERGADYIRERLLQAKRRGDIDDVTADMAEWFILKNPSLVDDLGVSVRTPGEAENGSRGRYMPATRVMRLFKESAGEETAVHEMLHHLERMMPEDMRSAIRNEYNSRLAAILKNGDANAKEYAGKVLEAAAGNAKAQDEAVKMIQSGKVPYAMYQMLNTSEFWAVNGASLMGKRFAAKDSGFAKIRQWFAEFVQKARSIIGLRSDAPIIRAMNDLLNKGDGKFVSKDMLSGSDRFFSVADDGWAELTGAKERIVGDSGRDYNDKQRQFFKNVGRDVSKKNIIGKTVDYLRSDFWKKMAVGIVDQFRGLRDLEDGGQAYMLARLSKGTAGAFDALLHHGKLSIKDGVYDADTSGGFVERLGVPLHGELDDALWWIAANRAESLSAQGKENLFSPEDIAAGKSLASGTTDFDYTIQTGIGKGKVTRNRAMIYADANRVFNEFQKNTLDMAEQSGLIDGSTRKFWESEFYVPFYRVSEEDGEFIGAKMGNALVRQQAFKKLKGGTDKLNSDLLSNTLLNWSHLIEASAKNRAAKAALTAAEKVGAAHKATYGEKKTVWYMGEITKTIPKGQEYTEGGVAKVSDGTAQITYIGKVEYGVDDQFVMTAITSLEYAGMRNAVMDVLTSFKHWLTIGVTASPAFKIRNLIRDSVSAIGTSDLGYNPIKNVTEGFKQTKRDSQEYVSALASGGLIRFGTMLEGSESARVRQLIKSGVKDSTILNSENKVRAFYDKVIDPAISAYNELGNRAEEINRAALYNQLIKQGKSHAEAALMARDLMDFAMQGSFNTIRFLTQVVPFMNARLQGLYKLGRAAKDDPRKMAVVTGAVAMASIALMLGYEDDEDWKRREDWDRDNFWWFKFGGIEHRVPKPFEIGAVATMAERSLEYMINDEMTGERFTKVTKDLVMNQLSMNPVPQAVKPIIDLYANKDSFTRRPIESMGMQRLDKDMRFNSSTSMVGRGLGSSIGILSPVQYDHLARAYFGWLGSFSVGIADMAIRAVNDEPTKPALDYWKFATQGILKEEGTGSSRYLSQLYEQAKELESAHATYRQLIKDGKIGDAQEYAEDNKEKLSRYRQVERVKNIETKFNERIREIERSDIDSDQKKERINNINKMKEAAARRLSPGVQGP